VCGGEAPAPNRTPVFHDAGNGKRSGFLGDAPGALTAGLVSRRIVRADCLGTWRIEGLAAFSACFNG
jgi:hypothetical protein